MVECYIYQHQPDPSWVMILPTSPKGHGPGRSSANAIDQLALQGAHVTQQLSLQNGRVT